MTRTLAALISASLLLTSSSASANTRAFPSVIMIRGGALTTPVVLHHRYDTSDPDAFRHDPIVRFYSDANSGPPTSLPEKYVLYEVAEYWGMEWVRKYGTDGRPIPGLKFLDSNRTALLFVAPSGVYYAHDSREPLRPGLHYTSGNKLGKDAISALKEAGLPVN